MASMTNIHLQKLHPALLNLCSVFCGRKLLKLLTVGYALSELPFSIGSKLELLSELCLCKPSVYFSVYSRICPHMYNNMWATYTVQPYDGVYVL